MDKLGIWEIAVILVVILIILGFLAVFFWITVRKSKKKNDTDK
jgi:uncharacterized membrane protein